ncbi:MAG: glycosyltransferase family 1 protein [Sphingomonadales bacterium]|nr:glycosyltransferase family 1 protein [Sphingomonadales bacterium]
MATHEVLINARFLVQRATGVQRVSREFTLAADRLLAEGRFPGLTLRLVAPQGADFASLGLRAIGTEHLAGGSGYRWEQVALARRVGRGALISLGNAAPIASLLCSRSIAVMIHDQSYRLFPRDYSLSYRAFHALMDRVILARARPLLTVSATEAAEIGRGNPWLRNAIVTAPNGSWIEDADPGPPVARPKRGFGLSVGGFTDRKNFLGAFRTALALAERGVEFRFVGTPSPMALAMLSQASDVARARIHYLGYVDNNALIDLYRGAAFLLYPSFYEASGLPPSEAMTFGCPVVVSDLPVMHERCGDAALFCDPHDVGSIVAAALRIVDDPSLASDLAIRGQMRAALFTWRNQAEIILSTVLRELEVGRASMPSATSWVRSTAEPPDRRGTGRFHRA